LVNKYLFILGWILNESDKYMTELIVYISNFVITIITSLYYFSKLIQKRNSVREVFTIKICGVGINWLILEKNIYVNISVKYYNCFPVMY